MQQFFPVPQHILNRLARVGAARVPIGHHRFTTWGQGFGGNMRQLHLHLTPYHPAAYGKRVHQSSDILISLYPEDQRPLSQPRPYPAALVRAAAEAYLDLVRAHDVLTAHDFLELVGIFSAAMEAPSAPTPKAPLRKPRNGTERRMLVAAHAAGRCLAERLALFDAIFQAHRDQVLLSGLGPQMARLAFDGPLAEALSNIEGSVVRLEGSAAETLQAGMLRAQGIREAYGWATYERIPYQLTTPRGFDADDPLMVARNLQRSAVDADDIPAESAPASDQDQRQSQRDGLGTVVAAVRRELLAPWHPLIQAGIAVLHIAGAPRFVDVRADMATVLLMQFLTAEDAMPTALPLILHRQQAEFDDALEASLAHSDPRVFLDAVVALAKDAVGVGSRMLERLDRERVALPHILAECGLSPDKDGDLASYLLANVHFPTRELGIRPFERRHWPAASIRCPVRAGRLTLVLRPGGPAWSARAAREALAVM